MVWQPWRAAPKHENENACLSSPAACLTAMPACMPRAIAGLLSEQVVAMKAEVMKGMNVFIAENNLSGEDGGCGACMSAPSAGCASAETSAHPNLAGSQCWRRCTPAGGRGTAGVLPCATTLARTWRAAGKAELCTGARLPCLRLQLSCWRSRRTQRGTEKPAKRRRGGRSERPRRQPTADEKLRASAISYCCETRPSSPVSEVEVRCAACCDTQGPCQRANLQRVVCERSLRCSLEAVLVCFTLEA